MIRDERIYMHLKFTAQFLLHVVCRSEAATGELPLLAMYPSRATDVRVLVEDLEPTEGGGYNLFFKQHISFPTFIFIIHQYLNSMHSKP